VDTVHSAMPAAASEPFITRGMSIVLDAVRALAAFAVLLGHAVQAGLYTGPFPFDLRMQHFAVVVFFVLSGLVIAHSTGVRHLSLREYAIARGARIVPVAWFAVLFGSALYLGSGESTVDVSNYDTLNLSAIVMPMLFMNESLWGTGPVWNPPYWSLAYEMWFYILFAGAMYTPAKWRWAVLSALGFLAGWRILLMLPIWLIGVWLARRAGGLRFGVAGSLLLLILATAAFLVANSYHNLIGVWMQAFHMVNGYAGLFIAIRPLADRWTASLERASRVIAYAAGFSYTLYIVHWPILMALNAAGITAGDDVAVLVVYLSGILGFAALLATQLEHRSGELRRWLLQRTAPRRVPETVRAA
jgi:peptidoglycan/LPS O-acetylase OafA/YrhL